MDFTKEQRDAIETRDKTLLVSAAAGSGKTATLTARIIASLLDEENPADISELLIVTFTNAAVGELKERIAAAIRGALEADPTNRRLERQLLLLPSATICTIDSFCNEVLRANVGAIGLAPNYRIADAAEAELLGGAICDSLIAAAYEGDLQGISSTVFAELCDCLTRVKTDGELAQTLLALYRKCETHEKGIHSLRALCEEYNPAAYIAPEKTSLGAYIMRKAKDAAAHYFSALQRILATYPVLGNATATLHILLAEEQDHFYTLSQAETYAQMRDLLMNFTFDGRPSIKGAEKTPEVETAIAMRDEYKAELKKIRENFFLYTEEQFNDLYTNLYKYTDTLCKFLEEFDFRFREEKARRGLCEYADIERYAYRCLWDGEKPSAYARELAERYSAVYIDEYQDVNRLQNLIFEAVSRENNRFMVGDIKQSIYSFRSADPSIFAAMKNSFPPLENAKESPNAGIFMSQNFRCDKGVVDFVNAVFDTVFGLLGESIGYVNADRLCFAKAPTERQLYPEITLVGTGVGTDGADAEGQESGGAVEAEARAVGAKILSLLDGETKNDGTPIRPGDIAVIMRALHSKASIYTRVFAELGIDCAVGDEKSLLLSPEVLLCLSLLNTIDNPHRDVYLAGLLCSPLYGFSADDLVSIRKNTPAETGKSLFSAVEIYAEAHPENERLARFLSSLARYQLMAEGMPVDALLTKLYAETSLLSLAAKNGGRDNLLLLKEYAARYEAGGFSGLYSFIHYINSLLEKRADFDTKRAAAADENRVQLITVHASKGLEYPVCFLAGCGTAISDMEKGPIAFVEDFGLAFRLRDSSELALVESPAVRAVLARRYERGFEEELRILYVALTRARERLYLYGTTGRTLPEAYLEKVEAQIPYLDAYSLSRMHSYLKLALAAKTPARVHCLGVSSENAEKQEEISDAAEAQASLQETEEGAEAVASAEEVSQKAECFVSRFTHRYAHENLAGVPGKLSVSALSSAVLDEREDRAMLLSEAPDPYLSASHEEEKEATAPTLPRFITGKRADESARRGIATHLFLQFCDFSALRAQGAKSELARLTEEKFLGKEDAQRVRLEEIEAFRRGRLLDEILSARAVHREMRFHARMPAHLFTESEEKKRALSDHRILVQGVIDCLYEAEDGRLTLIDYKTDRLPREALSDPAAAAVVLNEKHSEQLSYYALAVEEMFGKRPSRILVYSLHLGDFIEIKPIET